MSSSTYHNYEQEKLILGDVPRNTVTSMTYRIRKTWDKIDFLESYAEYIYFCIVVQFLNHVWLFAIPCTVAHQASLSFTVSLRLFKLMSIESMMPSNHLILYHLPPLLPSIFQVSGSFLMNWFFTSGGQSIGASPSVFLQWTCRVDFLQDWLVWSPCSPRDSQESSPALQLKSINSSALRLLS